MVRSVSRLGFPVAALYSGVFWTLAGCSFGDVTPSEETAPSADELRKNRGRAGARAHGHGKGHGHGHHGDCDHEPPAGSGAASSTGGMAGSGTAGTSPGTGGSGGMAGIPGSGGSGIAGSPGGSAGTGGLPDPGVCGNAIHEWDEECDFGDSEDGDGCSAACTIEIGYTCGFDGCHLVVCGDGLQDWYPLGNGEYGYEGCDDGNAVGGDGCSATCDAVEVGFVCWTPGEPCREVQCGDGFQDGYLVPDDPGSSGAGGSVGTAGTGMGGSAGAAGGGTYFFEACDDGNQVDGDGCTASCDVEEGYLCEVPGTPCREPRCGDGFQDFIWTPGGGTGGSSGGFAGTAGTGGGSGIYESCDDGNVASGDGCTSDCNIEDGYICSMPGTPCRVPTCGDGFVDFIPNPGGCGGGEGGASSGTSGSGGTFTAGTAGTGGGGWCGTYEQCDDGNTTESDGCSASCSQEDGYVCYEPGAPCTVPVCGDGLVEWPAEECDDANTDPNDGCDDCRGVW